LIFFNFLLIFFKIVLIFELFGLSDWAIAQILTTYLDTMRRLEEGGGAEEAGPALTEIELRAPLVGVALEGLNTQFQPSTFRANLPMFFPLLTQLIRCKEAPIEVSQRATNVNVLVNGTQSKWHTK
jgi:hypothetical protein